MSERDDQLRDDLDPGGDYSVRFGGIMAIWIVIIIGGCIFAWKRFGGEGSTSSPHTRAAQSSPFTRTQAHPSGWYPPKGDWEDLRAAAADTGHLEELEELGRVKLSGDGSKGDEEAIERIDSFRAKVERSMREQDLVLLPAAADWARLIEDAELVGLKSEVVSVGRVRVPRDENERSVAQAAQVKELAKLRADIDAVLSNPPRELWPSDAKWERLRRDALEVAMGPEFERTPRAHVPAKRELWSESDEGAVERIRMLMARVDKERRSPRIELYPSVSQWNSLRANAGRVGLAHLLEGVKRVSAPVHEALWSTEQKRELDAITSIQERVQERLSGPPPALTPGSLWSTLDGKVTVRVDEVSEDYLTLTVRSKHETLPAHDAIRVPWDMPGESARYRTYSSRPGDARFELGSWAARLTWKSHTPGQPVDPNAESVDLDLVFEC